MPKDLYEISHDRLDHMLCRIAGSIAYLKETLKLRVPGYRGAADKIRAGRKQARKIRAEIKRRQTTPACFCSVPDRE